MAGGVYLLVFCTTLLNAASLTAVRPSGSAGNLTCAGAFTLRHVACYSYSGSEVRRSFHQAERHCSKLRASLASLLSPAEEEFVLELADNHSAIWIGLTHQASAEGGSRFAWTDGAVVGSHARWREGEPSSASHLHCATADRGGWALAAAGCASTRLPFVCKRRACPEGLEWSGSDCGIISSPPPPSPLLSLPCSPSLVVMMVVGLSLALAVFCLPLHCSRSAHRHCHQTHTHHHKLPPSPHVQDLWLS